jgi:hypothetical protein
MSNAIEFLERLGRDAHLHRAPDQDIERALASMSLQPELLTAIRNADQSQLEQLLGAQTNVCCMIFAPEDDEDAPPEEDGLVSDTTSRVGNRSAA